MKELIVGGGIEAQEALSARKSDKLYTVLEASPKLFQIVPVQGSRSRMNICYRIAGEGLEKEFVSLAEKQGLTGLKGHRSVGGIRISNCEHSLGIFASNYCVSNHFCQIDNSISEEAIDKLVVYIKKFVEAHST